MNMSQVIFSICPAVNIPEPAAYIMSEGMCEFIGGGTWQTRWAGDISERLVLGVYDMGYGYGLPRPEA